jgi:shikimate kinase
VSDVRHIRNLVLIGFMGAGKSTIGRLASERLRFQFIDTDEWIERHTGRSIPDIFQKDGEAAFRLLEREVCHQLETLSDLVISTGGGLPTNPENMASLRKHALIIYLWASPEKIYERVRHSTHRPLLKTPDPMARIRQLLEARDPFYKQADVLVNTEQRSASEVLQQVVSHFRQGRSETSPSGGNDRAS